MKKNLSCLNSAAVTALPKHEQLLLENEWVKLDTIPPEICDILLKEVTNFLTDVGSFLRFDDYKWEDGGFTTFLQIFQSLAHSALQGKTLEEARNVKIPIGNQEIAIKDRKVILDFTKDSSLFSKLYQAMTQLRTGLEIKDREISDALGILISLSCMISRQVETVGGRRGLFQRIYNIIKNGAEDILMKRLKEYEVRQQQQKMGQQSPQLQQQQQFQQSPQLQQHNGLVHQQQQIFPPALLSQSLVQQVQQLQQESDKQIKQQLQQLQQLQQESGKQTKQQQFQRNPQLQQQGNGSALPVQPLQLQQQQQHFRQHQQYPGHVWAIPIPRLQQQQQQQQFQQKPQQLQQLQQQQQPPQTKRTAQQFDGGLKDNNEKFNPQSKPNKLNLKNLEKEQQKRTLYEKQIVTNEQQQKGSMQNRDKKNEGGMGV